MTTDREFESLVHSWLKEGGNTLSERVAAGVMANLATTAQRRAFPPIRRWRSLPAPTRFALASTAAVIVVAAVGAGILLARPGPNVGPTVATPLATSTATPLASPSPSPSASPDSGLTTKPAVIDSIDGLRITFDLPAGWTSDGSGARPSGRATSDVDVSFGVVDRVWQYPCRMPFLSNKSLAGTTPGDLAAKFRSAQGYTSTVPVDVLLAGYGGKRLQLQMPASMVDCFRSSGSTAPMTSYMLWIGQPTRYGSPGQRDDLRILDVDGVRLVIDAMSFPGTTAEDLAAQQRLIDSIQIQRMYSDAYPPALPVVRVDAIDGLRITYQLPRNWAYGAKLASPILATPAAPSVSFGTVDRVPRYPCTMPTFGIGPGPDTTVDQLAAAFDGVTEYDHTSPVGAALAGFSGARIDLTMPSESARPDCTDSSLVLWMSGEEVTRGLFGQQHQIWILDVEGVRLVIDATSFPGTSAVDMAARQQLIDSIRIERTAP